MKRILFVFVFVLLSALAHAGMNPWTNIDVYGQKVVPEKEVIRVLKERMIYFQKDGRCYAAIPYSVRGSGRSSFAVAIRFIDE